MRSTQHSSPTFDSLSDDAFVRSAQLASVVPWSKSTTWRKVRAGLFPAPTKISERITAWRVGDVRAWLAAQK